MDKKLKRGVLDFIIQFAITMILYTVIKSLGVLEVASDNILDITFIGCIIVGDVIYWFIKKILFNKKIRTGNY